MFHLIAKMFHLIILSYIRFLRSEPVERCSQKSATHSTLRLVQLHSLLRSET